MDFNIANVLLTGLVGCLAWIVGARSALTSQKQYQLDATLFASDWLRDLRSWATQAIEILSEAIYMSSSDSASDTSNLLMYRHRLSGLIDSGRFLLPNLGHEIYGVEKPTAYRGRRHRAIDCLVAAEKILGGDSDLERFNMGPPKSVLIEIKREFVSVVQEIIDPREQSRVIKSLLDIAYDNGATKGGFSNLLNKLSSQDN